VAREMQLVSAPSRIGAKTDHLYRSKQLKQKDRCVPKTLSVLI
jgi:hypothetical protein